jgi:hypothetical protein
MTNLSLSEDGWKLKLTKALEPHNSLHVCSEIISTAEMPVQADDTVLHAMSSSGALPLDISCLRVAAPRLVLIQELSSLNGRWTAPSFQNTSHQSKMMGPILGTLPSPRRSDFLAESRGAMAPHQRSITSCRTHHQKHAGGKSSL